MLDLAPILGSFDNEKLGMTDEFVHLDVPSMACPKSFDLMLYKYNHLIGPYPSLSITIR